MTTSEILEVVVGWFARVGGASLKLPSGWFGRPFDNLHRLTAARVEADRLVVVLDERIVLSLAHPSDAVADSTTLRLSGFTHAILDWDEYGHAGSHVETFAGGDLEFVHP